MPRIEKPRVFQRHSSNTKPIPPQATENSILTELDTEDRYRFNQYDRWELIPPLSLKSKRIHTLFIPFSDQTGLLFGSSAWQRVSAELQSSGNMVYQTKTSITEFNTVNPTGPDSRGYMSLDDVALASMHPKIQMIFSWNDIGINTASFIGIRHDAFAIVNVITDPFPTGAPVVGIGYRTSDTNIQLIHNDNAGAVNYINTGIPRSTNVFMLEIEYEATASVRITIFDINMEIIYNNILTTEIPPDGIDLGFLARIQNANTAAAYVINMFDYIRIEKTKPALSATIDF